jgi:hypothetical protein
MEVGISAEWEGALGQNHEKDRIMDERMIKTVKPFVD